MTQTVLITGTNRGVGLELTKAYLADGWRVIAAVRDPARMPSLGDLEGEMVVVKLDVGEKADAKKVVTELRSSGITSLDLVIANAGINRSRPKTFMEIDPDDQMEVFKINVQGPLLLLQATLEMLPPNHGKFVVLSSVPGIISGSHMPGNGMYGQSKAAVNFFVRKAHFEIPDRVILGVHPGWVPTEMRNIAAQCEGMDEAPGKFSETIPGMIKSIAAATKHTTSGTTINWSGEKLDW